MIQLIINIFNINNMWYCLKEVAAWDQKLLEKIMIQLIENPLKFCLFFN